MLLVRLRSKCSGRVGWCVDQIALAVGPRSGHWDPCLHEFSVGRVANSGCRGLDGRSGLGGRQEGVFHHGAEHPSHGPFWTVRSDGEYYSLLHDLALARTTCLRGRSHDPPHPPATLHSNFRVHVGVPCKRAAMRPSGPNAGRPKPGSPMPVTCIRIPNLGLGVFATLAC